MFPIFVYGETYCHAGYCSYTSPLCCSVCAGPNSSQRRRGRQTYSRYQTLELEKEFQFKINRERDEEKIRAIRTLNDIVGFIEAKQAEVLG